MTLPPNGSVRTSWLRVRSLEVGSKLERREILGNLQAELDNQRDEDPAITVKLLSLLARAAAFEHDWSTQGRLLTQALPSYRQIRAWLGEANTLISRARLAFATDDRSRDDAEMAEAIRIYTAVGLTEWAERFRAEAATWQTPDTETQNSSQ
ncbi:MAG TPA: hypothetical protein VJT72_14675 [Pseudonocardiaceae bacterium]|nr:hypothetical protein [Pseudonocardiaceae bacterium]